MRNLRLAIDDNLGLPAGFADGLAKVGTFDGCELVSFHDIGAMIEAFDNAEVAMMFAPAGTLPYLVAPPKIIAEATFGPQRGTALCSHLLVRSSDAPASMSETARRKVGCVRDAMARAKQTFGL